MNLDPSLFVYFAVALDVGDCGAGGGGGTAW